MSLFRRGAARGGRVEARSSWDWYLQTFAFGGSTYGLTGLQTTYGSTPTEPIPANFVGHVVHGLFGNGIVSTVETLRVQVFSEARFMWQRLVDGRPGDLFWTRALARLDEPWPGGTTGDLLARWLLHADLAGNGYLVAGDGDELVALRPDWCEIVLSPRELARGRDGQLVPVGSRKVGLIYTDGGVGSGNEPAVFTAGEFAHFAPMPDPLASFRGMSWLTPVLREIETDGQATRHKGKFFENGATPNIAVSLKLEDPDKFQKFVDLMDAQHKGLENAYKTLYTAAGADVAVIGADMQQIDFKTTQGAGETRIANAGGIHPVVAGLSEGMQGSSLNAGNYGAAKRSTVDRTFRPLWRNGCGSLRPLFEPPRSARLWYDPRDIAFLRDDAKDVAEIAFSEAQTIRQLVDAGYTPDSAVAAVAANDWSLLTHSGLYSVQLQPAGASAAATDPAADPADDAADQGDDPTDPTDPTDEEG